jgi:hypothetical protein
MAILRGDKIQFELKGYPGTVVPRQTCITVNAILRHAPSHIIQNTQFAWLAISEAPQVL